MSETMMWVLATSRWTSETMVRTSRQMSEMVPCVLLGKGVNLQEHWMRRLDIGFISSLDR